jgi:hypothetical protein
MLEAMAVEFSNLPGSIKIVVTIRNQPDIQDSLRNCSKEMCIEKAKGTAEDINAYCILSIACQESINYQAINACRP